MQDQSFSTDINDTEAENINAEVVGDNLHIAQSRAKQAIVATVVTAAEDSHQHSPDRTASLPSYGLMFRSGQKTVRAQIVGSAAPEIKVGIGIVTDQVALRVVEDSSIPKETVSKEGVFYLRPLGCEHYIERTLIFDRIHESLECSNRVVLCGMRGAGKSFLAKRYAHTHLKEYTSVYWFSADNPNKLEEDFQFFLSNAPQRPLVIFDGAFDCASLVSYLDRLSPVAKAIITSPYILWPASCQQILVPVFTREESIHYFEIHGKKIESDIQSLIEESYDHPLVLAQALTSILRNTSSARVYLERFRKNPALMLSGGNQKILPLGYTGEAVFNLWDRDFGVLGWKDTEKLKNYSLDVASNKLLQKVLSLKPELCADEKRVGFDLERK